nr:PA14 domain-containing protein [Woeseiaceae bacterium]
MRIDSVRTGLADIKMFGWLRVACFLFLLAFSSASWSQFNYSVYHGTWNLLPDFTPLTPVLTGTTDAINVSVSDVNDNFGLVFTNQLNVTVAGNYEFQTTSDDGSKLYIENTVVVDNDGTHAPVTETGQIFLNPGVYSLRVEFFERGGGEIIDVQYRVAGGTFAQIPSDGQLNGVVPSVADAGEWGPVITWPHIAISAANLPDGRVLTWSSTETNAFPSNREFTHSAVFNPADNTFVDTSSNFHDMFCAGVSMLETGEIVASGGNPDDSRTSVFNPGTLTWEPLAEMFDRRWYASNITLPNNDVFSTFGKSAGNRSEKYDADAN